MSEFAQSVNSTRFQSMRAGALLLALATILGGVLDLIWRDFDPGHQPIQALGVNIPVRALLACLAGLWMIIAGVALLGRRTARAGIVATAVIYLIFGLFSVPRFYTMTHMYGFHLTVILGVLGEMLLQFIVVAGCVILYTFSVSPAAALRNSSRLIGRCTFGLGGVLFGVAHFVNTRGVVHMIPKWMPFGAAFWVELSGACFLLAGVAILSGVLDLLAARLFALLLLVFEVFALVPILFGFPRLHQAWGATAYNLTAVGAVWIFASSMTNPDSSSSTMLKAGVDLRHWRRK
jgi:uncharacterized membrane protein